MFKNLNHTVAQTINAQPMALNEKFLSLPVPNASMTAPLLASGIGIDDSQCKLPLIALKQRM
jgi:hypothetical protein